MEDTAFLPTMHGQYDSWLKLVSVDSKVECFNLLFLAQVLQVRLRIRTNWTSPCELSCHTHVRKIQVAVEKSPWGVQVGSIQVDLTSKQDFLQASQSSPETLMPVDDPVHH